MILKNTFSALVMFTAAVLILAYQTSVQAKPLIDQRYSDNGDGTITDTKTNLIWQRCSLGQTWTGETCAGYAEGYNWPSAMKQVKDGWRLPTVDELDTLVLCTSNERSISRSYEGINSRCSGDYQEPTINTLAFPKTPEYFFWSSSEYVDENGGHNGWAISFRHGLVGPYHSNFMRDAHVRLVSTLTSAKTLINTWYAGTSYIGTVTTQGVTWHCSDGICKLSGEYGTGLNMAACKMLSSKVGGLSFYYDETGMTWSTTQNSALLEECNSH